MFHYVRGTDLAVFIGPGTKVTLTERTEASRAEMLKASKAITAAMEISDYAARSVIPQALKRMCQIDAEFSYELELNASLVALITLATAEEMKFTDDYTDPEKLDRLGLPICPPEPPEFETRRRVIDRLILAEIVKQHPGLYAGPNPA